MQKSKKSYDRFPRKVVTNGLTDTGQSIGPTSKVGGSTDMGQSIGPNSKVGGSKKLSVQSSLGSLIPFLSV